MKEIDTVKKLFCTLENIANSNNDMNNYIVKFILDEYNVSMNIGNFFIETINTTDEYGEYIVLKCGKRCKPKTLQFVIDNLRNICKKHFGDYGLWVQLGESEELIVTDVVIDKDKDIIKIMCEY